MSIYQFALKQGTKLQDRYRIDEVLGNNGVTITYKAFDTFRENVIVVKELFPSTIVERSKNDERTVSCMLMIHEATLLKMKEHMAREATNLIKLYPLEHISNIINMFEENQTLYVVMEYIEGVTLTEYAKGTALKYLQVRDLRNLLLPAMEDLEKIHKKGIVHGRIHPDSIRIAKGRKAVIIGFCDPMEECAEEILEKTSARVPKYAAVELYANQGGFGPATDVYAVAAIFYEMVTSSEIPEFYERFNHIQETGSDSLVPPNQINPYIMQIQSTVIMAALNIYHFDRYQSIMDFMNSLSDEDFSGDEVVIKNQVPLWIKVLNRYNKIIIAILIVGALLWGLYLIPKLSGIAKTETAESFYREIESGELEEIVEAVVSVPKDKRKDYANDYSVMAESADTDVYYYDVITKRYTVIDEVPDGDIRVRYIRVDYRLNNTAIVTIKNDSEVRILTIELKKDYKGEYKVEETFAGSKKGSNTYYIKL